MARKNDKRKWKRNIRKIPDWISAKVAELPRDSLIVGCVKKISLSAIDDGEYSHLDFKIEDGSAVFPSEATPKPHAGSYSKTNLFGREVVRKDLPMITKTFTWETPNYGDSWKGYHEVSMDRQVYVRDFVAPKGLNLKIDLLGKEGLEQGLLVLRFIVDEVLDRNSAEFESDLFYNLNLLQENVGRIDVFPSDATRRDFLKTVYVDWEILPPGEDPTPRILSGFGSASEETKKRLVARYELLNGLGPSAYISGTSGFQRYFGAKFGNDLVVFENLEYGNALYIMFEDWQELSRKSRIELLRGDRDGFARIIHRHGWEEKLKTTIREKRSS